MKVAVIVRQLSKDFAPVVHSVHNIPADETEGWWVENLRTEQRCEHVSKFPEFRDAVFYAQVLEVKP